MNATAVRRKGDAEEYYNTSVESNAYGCALGHHDGGTVLVLMCITDTNGVIEWKVENTGPGGTVELIAYIK
jgi:hypothetical protein